MERTNERSNAFTDADGGRESMKDISPTISPELSFAISRLRSGAPDAANQALDQYRKARDAWSVMARRAQKIYRDNITYGNIPIRQGQWMDRLPGIEKDMASVQAVLNGKAGSTTVDSKQVGQAIRAVTQRRRRPSVACSHTVPQGFQPGKPLPVTLSLTGKNANAVAPSVLLHYRHVNQAERWHSVDMDKHTPLFSRRYQANTRTRRFPCSTTLSSDEAVRRRGFIPHLTRLCPISRTSQFLIGKADV